MTGETVHAMIERSAKIRAECEVAPIGHSGPADLHAIARAKGGDYSLANRRPPCRVPGCPGRVRFVDMTSVWPRSLDTITDRNAAWWNYSAAEKARLYALGWWLEMGKWRPPPEPRYGSETTKGPPSEENGPLQRDERNA